MLAITRRVTGSMNRFGRERFTATHTIVSLTTIAIL